MMLMLSIRFVPMKPEYARDLLTWRYPPPYDIYNEADVSIQERENIVRFLCDPINNYSAMLTDQGDYIGGCSHGFDAQVEGGDYSEDAFDVGLGLRPDYTGRGFGAQVVRQIIRFYHPRQPRKYRATIAGFNRRSQRVFEKNGFQRTQTFVRPSDGMEFHVYMRGPLTEEELAARSDGEDSAS
jgi:[ribosomal protein S18]-alanine N-acetyltransferase